MTYWILDGNGNGRQRKKAYCGVLDKCIGHMGNSPKLFRRNQSQDFSEWEGKWAETQFGVCGYYNPITICGKLGNMSNTMSQYLQSVNSH